MQMAASHAYGATLIVTMIDDDDDAVACQSAIIPTAVSTSKLPFVRRGSSFALKHGGVPTHAGAIQPFLTAWRHALVLAVCVLPAERYLFYWYLMQDGRIEFEIKLSGELSTNLLSEGESKPQHGVLVAPGVNAQLHQVHGVCRARPASSVVGAFSRKFNGNAATG